MKKINNYKSLSSKLVEEELKRETYKVKYINLLKNTIFTLIVVAAIITIISSYILSVFEVSGESMIPALDEGQIVVAFHDKSIKANDVIAFYQGNKILIKRVIATQGSYVNIDDDGNVYVDGNLLDEPYVLEKTLGDSNIKYPYQVPDGHYFVLGDKRNTSIDSRYDIIGAVSNENVIGKVVISVWPLNKMGIVK